MTREHALERLAAASATAAAARNAIALVEDQSSSVTKEQVIASAADDLARAVEVLAGVVEAVLRGEVAP